MGLSSGVHHLAISPADTRARLGFLLVREHTSIAMHAISPAELRGWAYDGGRTRRAEQIRGKLDNSHGSATRE